MDSDDELIVKMKQAKYQEKEIAQRLIDEGRTNYHAKTIGTRWARLKRVLQARNDDLLDQDLTDWHEGDVKFPAHEHKRKWLMLVQDDVLEDAIAETDKEIERLKQEVESKKWRMVADKIKLKKVSVS